MKKSVIVLLVLVVLALLGLGLWFFVNPKKALEVVVPEIESLEKMEMRVEADTAHTSLVLRAANKGWFTLNIDSLMFRVRLDSELIVSRTEPVKLRLPRGAEDTLRLTIPFPYKRVSEKIRDLQGQDRVDVIVRLRVVYSTVFGRASLPIRKVTAMEVPVPPSFEVEKVRYLGRKGKTGSFAAFVRMHNYGKADLTVSDVGYVVTMSKGLRAQGKHPEPVVVKPKSDLLVQLPFDVEFKSAMKAIAMVLTDNDKVAYDVKITGKMRSGKLGPETIPVEIEKKGEMELKQ